MAWIHIAQVNSSEEKLQQTLHSQNLTVKRKAILRGLDEDLDRDDSSETGVEVLEQVTDAMVKRESWYAEDVSYLRPICPASISSTLIKSDKLL